MWRHVGIESDGVGLTTALDKLAFWSRYVFQHTFASPDGWELQNMLTVALLITSSALKRQESRGVHYRTDFPELDDKGWKKHLVV